MKMIFLAIMTSVLLTVHIVKAGEKSYDELIQESERMWMEHKFDESDRLLDEAMKIDPNLTEAYWRKARNEYERLEDIPRDKKPDKETLIARYRAMEAVCDKCLELNENEAGCWALKGVAMGRRGTTQGMLRSLWMAYDIEQAWLKAISLKPQYRSEDGADNILANMYHALGMFYRLVPEWLCYFPLKQIIGTCGDLEKSVEYQRKAVALEPNRVEFHRELAVSLLCHGQQYDVPEEIEEAKKILIKIQSMAELKSWGKIDKEHARMLLEDPSLACGYQRDAQQEWREEAYEKN